MPSETQGKIILFISTSPSLLQGRVCVLWFVVEMRLRWSFGCVLRKGLFLQLGSN